MAKTKPGVYMHDNLKPRNFYNETSSDSPFNSLWIVEIVSLFCRFLFRYTVSSFVELRLAIQVLHVRNVEIIFTFLLIFLLLNFVILVFNLDVNLRSVAS